MKTHKSSGRNTLLPLSNDPYKKEHCRYSFNLRIIFANYIPFVILREPLRWYFVGSRLFCTYAFIIFDTYKDHSYLKYYIALTC